MKIGERIKNLRASKNMTQMDLSYKLGVHNQTISKWEREIGEPDFSMLGIIAKALSVSLENLLGVETDKEVVEGVFDTVKMGNTIRLFRTHLNLSQSQLATKLNTSSDIVSKWERGYVCPDVEKLISLASIFSLSPSALYFGQAKPKKTTVKIKDKSQKRTIIVISIICALAILISSLFSFLLFENCADKTPNETPPGDQTQTPVEVTFTSPLDNISVYETEKYRWCDFHGRFCFNQGVYLIANINDTVYSIMDGTVEEFIGFNSVIQDIEYMGKKIVIKNGDYVCTYYSVIPIEGLGVGSVIQKGDVIGKVGNHPTVYCEKDFSSLVLYVTLKLDNEYLDPFESFLKK